MDVGWFFKIRSYMVDGFKCRDYVLVHLTNGWSHLTHAFQLEETMGIWIKSMAIGNRMCYSIFGWLRQYIQHWGTQFRQVVGEPNSCVGHYIFLVVGFIYAHSVNGLKLQTTNPFVPVPTTAAMFHPNLFIRDDTDVKNTNQHVTNVGHIGNGCSSSFLLFPLGNMIVVLRGCGCLILDFLVGPQTSPNHHKGGNGLLVEFRELQYW